MPSSKTPPSFLRATTSGTDVLTDATAARGARTAGAPDWSERTFRALVEHSRDVILVLDLQGVVRYASPAVRPVLGHARREVVGRCVTELVHPADAEDLREAMRWLLDAPRADLRVEVRVAHRDGSWRWLEVDARNLAHDPHVQGVVVSARDVTERRIARDELEASDQRFRLAFEASPIAMFLSTPDGTITRANGAFGDLLGYSGEEIEELGWASITHPDDRARSTELHVAMERGEIGEYQFEKRYYHKDGHVVWVHLTASLVRDRATGVPSYIFAQVHDIGERKRAEEMLRVTEERFRLLGRATQDLVYDWDMTTDAVYRSDGVESIFGHDASARSSSIGWWVERVHPDDRDRVSRTIDAALASRADAWAEEYRFARGDGSWATVSDRGYLVYGDDGRAVRMIGAMHDVTEQKELESHLRQAQKMDAVGRLAGGIAHDFNNLLTVISANCELILNEVAPDSTVTSDVGEIRDAALRAAGLTRQLLAFSRRQVLQLSVLDLNEVIGDIEKMLRRVIGEDVSLRVQLEPALGCVRGDRNQLEQVLLNLAVNARDAMPGGGTLTITTANAEVSQLAARRRPGFRPGSYVQLRVRDSGVGMTADLVARIFEPFFTTKELGKGTGLGLSTVYGIVKQSQGFIYVESQPGVGSEFLVYLPRVADEVTPSGTAASSGGWALPQAEELRPLVLLVEDEASVRAVLRRSLERCGFDILEARSAHEALALEARFGDRVDAVLSDVVMPGMSGRALATELRARRPDLPIQLMSGYPDSDGNVTPLPEGVGAVMQKPLNTEELASRLRKLIHARG